MTKKDQNLKKNNNNLVQVTRRCYSRQISACSKDQSDERERN